MPPGVLVPTSDYFRYLTLGSEVFVVQYLFYCYYHRFMFVYMLFGPDKNLSRQIQNKNKRRKNFWALKHHKLPL